MLIRQLSNLPECIQKDRLFRASGKPIGFIYCTPCSQDAVDFDEAVSMFLEGVPFNPHTEYHCPRCESSDVVIEIPPDIRRGGETEFLESLYFR